MSDAEEIEMQKPGRARPTPTLLIKVKRAAKAAVRNDGLSHHEALERGAEAAGYNSWHELQQAVLQAVEADVDDFPVDPRLPALFDQTPNEERSKAELDRWWDRPFARSIEDGGFEVRCLDGGAWDRSTFYGVAPDLAAARQLGREKLEHWKAMRSRPTIFIEGPDEVLVVQMPQRPDDQMTVLYRATDTTSAARWIEQHTKQGTALDT